jgi:hypothetical protein
MEPALKSKINMIFRDLAICSPMTIGIGRTKTIRSVIMLSTPVAMYNDVLLRHFPPWIETSMFFANGSHAASREMTIPTQDPTTTNMVT